MCTTAGPTQDTIWCVGYKGGGGGGGALLCTDGAGEFNQLVGTIVYMAPEVIKVCAACEHQDRVGMQCETAWECTTRLAH